MKTLFLVDGDNYPEPGSRGLEQVQPCRDNKIIIVANTMTKLSNYRLRIKNRNPELFLKARVGFIKVPKTPQAADNRIKSILGQECVNNEFDSIYVISHDHDFTEYIQKLSKRGVNTENISCRKCFAVCM